MTLKNTETIVGLVPRLNIAEHHEQKDILWVFSLTSPLTIRYDAQPVILYHVHLYL